MESTMTANELFVKYVEDATKRFDCDGVEINDRYIRVVVPNEEETHKAEAIIREEIERHEVAHENFHAMLDVAKDKKGRHIVEIVI